jgi:hypothetical protein
VGEGDELMSEKKPSIFFYRVFQIFSYAGALPFFINTLDIVLNPTSPPFDGGMAYRLVSGLLLAPISLVVGILCVRRVPGNLIGWMLITFSYGISALAMRVDILPITPILLIANLFVTFFWMSYLLIPLYFPNGQLFPPRMSRWGNRVLAIVMSVLFFSPLVFSPTISSGSGDNELSVPNPFFIIEFDYTAISVPLLVIILILGFISLFLRYRSGNHMERLQLRWLLAGVIVQFGILLFSSKLAEILNVDPTFIGSLYTVIIPIAIGIAILRHRLYDIDIIIRRTLIYSVLTGILAAVYFGAIILTQQLFQLATGEVPDFAIVLSTLLIAALFSPLRRRVQDTIDRRLYRRKYDVEQTLADFQKNLREDVDMETLKANLIGVVSETMQPTQVRLWVKEVK